MTTRLTFDIAAQDTTGQAFASVKAAAGDLQAALSSVRVDVDKNFNVALAEKRLRDLGAVGRATMAEIQAASRLSGMQSTGTTMVDRMAPAIRATRVETGNLAAQLNDIAVSLASGQSPFTVMLQQGAQISQAFGPGTGVKGVFAGLGQAAMSMLNPVNAVLFGLLGVGAAAASYFAGGKSAAEKLTDLFKAHEAVIAATKERYGEAAAGLRDYAQQSAAILQALNAGNLSKLQGELKTLSTAAIDALGVFTFRGSIKDIVQAPFKPFTTSILEFVETAKAGKPDVVAFREAVAATMTANPGNAGIQAAGRSILELTDNAGKVAGAMASAEAAMKSAGNAALVGAGGINAYAQALAAMNGVALKSRPVDALNENLGKALDVALAKGDPALVNNAVAAYKAGLQRIDDAEREAAAKSAARVAAQPRQESEYERATDALEKKIAASRAEAALVGASEAVRARSTALIDLNTAAMESNQRAKKGDAVITAEQAANNARLADSYAAVVAKAEAAQKAHTALVQRADEVRSTFSSTVSAFGQTFLTTRSWAEAGVAALNALASAAMNAGIKLAEAALFGQQGQAFGGLLGSLFGLGATPTAAPVAVLHSGGRVGSHNSSRMDSAAAYIGAPRMHSGGIGGLKSDEVRAVLRKGEVVDPGDGSVFRKVFGEGGGGNVYHINAQGADPAVVTRIERALAEHERRLKTMPATVADANRRKGMR
jgi:hypothetical protein